MITPSELADLIAAAEAATPGPWFVLGQPWRRSDDDSQTIIAGSDDPHGAPVICDWDTFCHANDGEDDEAEIDQAANNFRFIALANPQTVMDLVREITRLTKIVDRYKIAYADLRLTEARLENERDTWKQRVDREQRITEEFRAERDAALAQLGTTEHIVEELQDDIFAQDEADAANTRCDKCDRPYVAVRPGKIQPTCSCDYIDRLMSERDETLAMFDRAQNERDAALEVVDRLRKTSDVNVMAQCNALKAEHAAGAIEGLEQAAKLCRANGQEAACNAEKMPMGYMRALQAAVAQVNFLAAESIEEAIEKRKGEKG